MNRATKMTLPASVSSPEDLREAIDELHAYRRAGGQLSSNARDILQQAGYTASDAASVDVLVATLRTLYDEAPRVTLTLSAPPDPKSRAVLTGWFRDNCSPVTLVTFGLNRALLGGATVRAGSRIHDWSYRSRLLDSGVKFSEVLGRV